MFNSSLDFEVGPIRPPDEANSLLIRTTRGCPWNKCSFCTLFKGHRFSIRRIEDIKSDILSAAEHYRGVPFKSCFLQDGDSFVMKTADLIDILRLLKSHFPSITRISSYGRAQSMIRKSPSELKEIHDAGLNMLYCGMESGADEVLRLHNKGTTAQKIMESAINAREAGMQTMMFLILGLGGRKFSTEHINESARVINSINPEDIRILSLAAKNGTPLGDLVAKGKFEMLSEKEMMEEQRSLIGQLDNVQSRYGNYHMIDLMTEIKGRLPEDQTILIGKIDEFLDLPESIQHNFVLGRRTGYYSNLAEMKDERKFAIVSDHLSKILQSGGCIEDTFHQMRQQMI